MVISATQPHALLTIERIDGLMHCQIAGAQWLATTKRKYRGNKKNAGNAVPIATCGLEV